jgi:alpha-beta hydrolase superfamily lysophospholipase
MPVPSYPNEAEARHEEGFVNSADHLRLFWQRFTPPDPRATVAILHGAADHSGRFPAITTALVRAGFQVALLDFRGHGQSDGRRWHVDAFSDYLGDVDAFVAKLRADGVARGKLFILGHSQGGLVSVLWGFAHGREVEGFLLSAPWLRLALRPPLAKLLFAKVVGRLIPWLPIPARLDPADLSSDVDVQRWTARDPLYGRAATPRWFDQVLRTQLEVLRRAGEFEAPLLVLAPSADPIADVTATRQLVETVRSQDKRMVVYDGFRHEIFNEVRREEPIAEAIAWLEAHAR